MNGTLFIISAPSGAGKTSVVNAVIKKLNPPYAIKRTVTCTTKQPRATEVQGADYYFMSPEEFKRKIEQNYFLEWSDAYGAYYGSPSTIIEDLKQGISHITILDYAGAQSLKKAFPQAYSIWIMPPSIEVLRQRLRARATETEEEVARRLQLAKQELLQKEHLNFFDYQLINDNFEQTCTMLSNLIEHILLKSAKKRL